MIFGGALLISPPDSHRLLGALPAVCLLAASALVWLLRVVWRWWGENRPGIHRAFLPVAAILAVLLIAGDVLFYFGEYRQSNRFADRNTEIAYNIATYLQSLSEPHTAYLYGPPTLYADFPTIPFLAPNFQADLNLYNVLEPGAELQEPRQPDSDLLFLFLPERAGELAAVQEQYPAGDFQTFENNQGIPLFLAYRVDR